MKPISQEAQTPPASAPKTASETFRFELRQPPAKPNKPKAPRVKAPSVEAPVTLVFTGLFGIILPAATIAIELYTHMCAEVFFDPLPTFGHALLVCAGSAGTGERALHVSVDAALRAGIFKASGSIDPIGFGDERERGLPRPWSSSR